MPFIVYKYHVKDSTIYFERLRAIGLSGPQGAVAKFVKSLPADEVEEGWQMAPDTLIRLGGVSDTEGNMAVLFEVSTGDPNSLCLYRLHRLCGLTRDLKTHLSLEFEVLLDESVGMEASDLRRAFSRPTQPPGKRLCEVLQLGGGLGGGQWKWEAPAMNLGATLVNPPHAGASAA